MSLTGLPVMTEVFGGPADERSECSAINLWRIQESWIRIANLNLDFEIGSPHFEWFLNLEFWLSEVVGDWRRIRSIEQSIARPWKARFFSINKWSAYFPLGKRDLKAALVELLKFVGCLEKLSIRLFIWIKFGQHFCWCSFLLLGWTLGSLWPGHLKERSVRPIWWRDWRSTLSSVSSNLELIRITLSLSLL